MPKILPELTIIYGLDEETAAAYNMNLDLLKKIRNEGLIVRKINIR